ncbi:hypothetical protein DFH07DRAFT_961574 [Mycena maculata]|uniref:Uncharacterized protein n=1 Tax=Mycena maculata TaxID=230809 RepID=A0AAD7N886_9AGAR|nr:hypothetical protein DFH07DRAFT_961574 [Mycena maculata]
MHRRGIKPLHPVLGQYIEFYNPISYHRFDTPPGFENNPADCNKILKEIGEAFTQNRARFKKILLASVKIRRDKKLVDPPPNKHQNLFGLAQAFVEGTNCRISPGLCGRIALMRKVFLLHPDSDFWDQLDEHLVVMRTLANGDSDESDLLFEGLIDKDKEQHGSVDIVYQGAGTIQEEVDAAIAANAIDATITVNPDALAADDTINGPGGSEAGPSNGD